MPAPLTERERLLIDRVELLEKRVAELEAKRPTLDYFSAKPLFHSRATWGVNMAAESAAMEIPPKAPSKVSSAICSTTAFGFDKDKHGLTIGGGQINNLGRYLVLLPPINGATATSGTPYFTENPGDPYKAWDVSGTFDWMPSQYITFRWEYNHRGANKSMAPDLAIGLQRHLR